MTKVLQTVRVSDNTSELNAFGEVDIESKLITRCIRLLTFNNPTIRSTIRNSSLSGHIDMHIKNDQSGNTWYCVRKNGRRKHEGWIENIELSSIRNRVNARSDEIVEICVATNFRPVKPKQFYRAFYNRIRGLVGIEIVFEEEIIRIAPTKMIASNLSFDRVLEKFLAEMNIEMDDFVSIGKLYSISASQFLLIGKNEDEVQGLFRGSTVVAPKSESIESRAAKLINGIEQWMNANMSADGEIPYKYWPSRGTESPADNAIRRFLGSWTLARLGEYRKSSQIREAARLNLRYNLHRYFREIGEGRGAIVESTGAKLGASAVAGLAIMANNASEEFSQELEMLATGISSLVDAQLGFRTFFFPAERDGENWNFYSGEALLFWAEAVRRGMTFAPSLESCKGVFLRCCARHYRKRNPAFIPWHTQACVLLFVETGHREFADFALEMSDWLLPMQQCEGLQPDLCGRFYNPRHPEYGPPHAASTGAYLEGIADALALAKFLGEKTRTSAYQNVIRLGLRSLRQLQFRDRRDAFYISKPTRVLGALRTETYDNSIRVDSASHALSAALKILQPIKFNPRHSLN